jgi:hypothetical protein
MGAVVLPFAVLQTPFAFFPSPFPFFALQLVVDVRMTALEAPKEGGANAVQSAPPAKPRKQVKKEQKSDLKVMLLPLPLPFSFL